MMAKDIIDLKPERDDDGEIIYASSGRPQGPPPAWKNALNRILAFTIFICGVVIFLALFLYVILPIIALILIFLLVRNIIRALK